MDMDYVFTDIANPEIVLKEAREWLNLYYKEKKLPEAAYPSLYSFLSLIYPFFPAPVHPLLCSLFSTSHIYCFDKGQALLRA